MKTSDEQTKLLRVLEEVPLISHACKKSNISRATFYRWYKDNPAFKRKVDKATKLGRNNITDLAESMLIKNVKSGDMAAVRFFLQHNDPRYIPKRSLYVLPPKETNRGQYDKCDECGQSPMPPEKVYPILKAMQNYGMTIGIPDTMEEYVKQERQNKKETKKNFLNFD